VTKFCMLGPNMCAFLVWNSLYVTSLKTRIFKWLLGGWKYL